MLVVDNLSVYFLWLALPSVLRNVDPGELLEVWIISKAFQVLVTAAEALRNLPAERDWMQIIYEISTFPEVRRLGAWYQCYEWIAHPETFFFFFFKLTISSKTTIVCTGKFYKSHFYAHLPPVLTTGFLLFLTCTSIKALCFPLSSQPVVWAFM